VSADLLSTASSADVEYASVWCDCTARVLESLQGAPVTGTAKRADSEPGLPAAEMEDQCLWLRFKVTGRLEGEHAFQIAKSDAVRLAQLLMSEPMDASVAFADTHADAVNEIFRQFAGLAATSCKSKYGGEVQFQLEEGLTRPDWTPASSVQGIFAAPQMPPIQWLLSISRELYAVIGVLDAAREARPAQAAPTGRPNFGTQAPASPPDAAPAATAESKASPAPPATPPPAPAVASPSLASPSNLDLLLDIELDASLRFGQCEMVLREILELRPGSVVELNRQIQEPAELLVAGRVIARGDVVIIDGSYGLRITDIAQPEQRLKSLQTQTQPAPLSQ
jgi:flagellar motor switch protein FliN